MAVGGHRHSTKIPVYKALEAGNDKSVLGWQLVAPLSHRGGILSSKCEIDATTMS